MLGSQYLKMLNRLMMKEGDMGSLGPSQNGMAPGPKFKYPYSLIIKCCCFQLLFVWSDRKPGYQS